MRADGAARLRSFAAPSAKIGSTGNPKSKLDQAASLLELQVAKTKHSLRTRAPHSCLL